MALTDLFCIEGVGGTPSFRIDSSGNIIASGTIGLTTAEGASIYLADSSALGFGNDQDVAFAWDGTKLAVTQAAANSAIHLGISGAGFDLVLHGDTAGVNATWDQSRDALALTDNAKIEVGTGTDLTITHNGTNTLVTSATGNLVIDNTAATGATLIDLGTDTNAVHMAVRTDSGNEVFSVTPSSATAATVVVAGVLDLNGTLDQDFALLGTGDGANITGTINHATQAAEGIDVSIAQLTTARSAGVVAAAKLATTSLAGDSGGDYACVYLSHTDGGGSAVHVGLYCDTALDGLLKVDQTGRGGVTVGAMTAKSPESDTEAGYFSIFVGATRYEVPFYAVT